MVAALVIYAFYAAFLRMRPPLGSASFLTVLMILGALLLVPFTVWEAQHGEISLTLDPLSIGVILYVSVFPALIAYLCFNRGVELIGANRAAPFFHLMPEFGSVLAILLLGETFAWYHGLGYAMVLAGIVTATRSGAKAATPLE
ncbi:MAG: hypothetical protein B7X76_03245 [Azorhizobium sp. 39-67-5]|nr:MAG: hypothetical protein B7X76_03245 [Azorhizobium sp. 39-67-5]